MRMINWAVLRMTRRRRPQLGAPGRRPPPRWGAVKLRGALLISLMLSSTIGGIRSVSIMPRLKWWLWAESGSASVSNAAGRGRVPLFFLHNFFSVYVCVYPCVNLFLYGSLWIFCSCMDLWEFLVLVWICWS